MLNVAGIAASVVAGENLYQERLLAVAGSEVREGLPAVPAEFAAEGPESACLQVAASHVLDLVVNSAMVIVVVDYLQIGFAPDGP
jgi:hypothetical protein